MTNLVGQKAPNFKSDAILSDGTFCNNFDLHNRIENKYGLLFFYPLNFTFVCPSELIALSKNIGELKKRDVETIGISVDSHFSHNAWRNMPIKDGGIGNINYPLVSDVSHKIIKTYGVEHQIENVAFRAVFIIDKKKNIRIQHINDLPIGRSISEIVRLIDAIQFHEKNGDVCPVNWEKGEDGMKPTGEGVKNYLNKNFV